MSFKKSAEISWFAPICDGDDDFLVIEIRCIKVLGKTPARSFKQQTN